MPARLKPDAEGIHPTTGPPTAVGMQRPPVGTSERRPLRVLLIEDTDDDAELATRELRRGGYAPTVTRVLSGEAFRAALQVAFWDVIISDHTVPGYGGLMALADLQATGKDIPFILVSGSIGEAVAVGAMRAGAQDYVLKRFPVAVEREVRERSVRAERAKFREQLLISDRMASAGTLAGGVAHEINNPLGVAMANLDFILDTLATISPDRAGEEGQVAAAQLWSGWTRLRALDNPLRDAAEALRRIRDVVRDVKVFSRPEEEKNGPIDVRRIIDSSVRMAHTQIRHRARLIEDYRSVPLVEANESRLGQVILNLLVNALQRLDTAGTRRPRRHRGCGHRLGHLEGKPRPHLRPLLHDEARRHRDGSRSRDLSPHRVRARGDDRRRQRRRQRHDVPRGSPRCQRASDERKARERPPGVATPRPGARRRRRTRDGARDRAVPLGPS
jgi:signal transduction histidine kinase